MTRAVQEFPSSDRSVLVDGSAVVPFVAVVVVLMAASLVLFLWLLVRNLRLIRRADTARTGTTRAPLEQRLRELDDLHRRGVISDAEHAAARQRTLTSS